MSWDYNLTKGGSKWKMKNEKENQGGQKSLSSQNDYSKDSSNLLNQSFARKNQNIKEKCTKERLNIKEATYLSDRAIKSFTKIKRWVLSLKSLRKKSERGSSRGYFIKAMANIEESACLA